MQPVDRERLTELRRWATQLQESSSNEELRAAGRAILMLTEEVTHLTSQLDEARSSLQDVDQEAGPDDVETEHGGRAWFRRTFGLGVFDEDYEESKPG
jgi:hypothetical protein